MDDTIFKSYPIRNQYEYWLPQINILNSDNIGRFSLKDINIYTEPDYINDCHSEDHRFNTFHCNNIANDESAWMVGLELTSLLRGLVTIFYGESYQQHIYLEKMTKHGDPTVSYPNYKLGNDISLPADIYLNLGSSLIHNLTPPERREYKKNAKSNVLNSSLYLAKENLGLYTLLKYFSEPLTWVSLYKIMETLENLQKSYDKSWTIPYNSKQREKFTNPANNFGAIGTDARHGFATSKKPNNSTKMDIQEAKDMFIDSTKSYLNFKLEEFRATP